MSVLRLYLNSIGSCADRVEFADVDPRRRRLGLAGRLRAGLDEVREPVGLVRELLGEVRLERLEPDRQSESLAPDVHAEAVLGAQPLDLLLDAQRGQIEIEERDVEARAIT